MNDSNRKVIISGIGLLLFGIIIAIEGDSGLSYLSGILGLFFVIGGCLIKE